MEHYFSEKPESEQKMSILPYRMYQKDFQFYTASSVFSKDKVDKGTQLLIREARIRPDSSVLDIGCGYGPVGIVLSKKYPDAKITMSDINERAVSLAQKNLELNNCKATVILSNIFDNIDEKFDIILSNPPQSAGKSVCFKIIEDSFMHLNKNGSLQLVVRHQKGGKTLSKKMEEIFGNVKTLARKSGYHVYYSEKDK